MERWKDVKGYEGLYMVSDSGRVMSVGKKSNHKESIILKPSNSLGYRVVSLRKDNKAKIYKVHRLVANAFVDNPSNKKQVNHIDGDKANNNAYNLEWVTASENAKHAFKSGLNSPQRGKDNRRSIKVTQLTKSGIFVSEFCGMREAERKTGVSRHGISLCARGKAKSAGGYIWKVG